MNLAERATEDWWDTPHYGIWLDDYYAEEQNLSAKT
jgi:hypothetical protein